jgi:hypothetical protein
MNQEGENDPRTIVHTEPSKTEKKKGDDHRTPVIKSRETPPNPPNTNDKQTRGERYFYLGTQAALVIITAIGIRIAIESLNTLNNSVNAANRQATAANTQAAAASTAAQAAVNANIESDIQFRLSERPWVGLASLRNVGPVVLNRNQTGHVEIRVTLENGGRSPAIGVISFYDLIFARSPDDAVKVTNRLFCDRDTLTVFTSGLEGIMMFPNIPDSSYQRVTTNGPPIGKSTGGNYMILLVACIGYHNQLGELFHAEPIWLYEGKDKARSFDIRRAKKIVGRFQTVLYHPIASFK